MYRNRFIAALCALQMTACAVLGRPVWEKQEVQYDDVVKPSLKLCKGAGLFEVDQLLRSQLGYDPTAFGVKGDVMMVSWPVPTLGAPYRAIMLFRKTLTGWHLIRTEICDERDGKCEKQPLSHCTDSWDET